MSYDDPITRNALEGIHEASDGGLTLHQRVLYQEAYANRNPYAYQEVTKITNNIRTDDKDQQQITAELTDRYKKDNTKLGIEPHADKYETAEIVAAKTRDFADDITSAVEDIEKSAEKFNP